MLIQLKIGAIPSVDLLWSTYGISLIFINVSQKRIQFCCKVKRYQIIKLVIYTYFGITI